MGGYVPRNIEVPNVLHQKQDSGAATPPKLILIAEDSADNRELYAYAVTRAGFRLAFAEDGHECLQRARELAPALIVMDLSLPNLDGLEATRQLKADERTRHIPVIVLTAYGWETVKQDAYRHGCEGFLVKPCPPDGLLKEIDRLLSRSADR
jgi:two-component system cell cycle response regulator DivK